jgi:hypothetical protein
MIDIREIDGLWCDDITFCPEQCGWISCPRNKRNIRDRTIPHSFSVEIPQDCPKQQKAETGHWIYKKYDDMFMCSCCEKYSIRNDYPYCHWCGAKMEGR